MNIQIFGTKKCNDTKKAQRFFKERNIKFQFIDLQEKSMSKGEIKSVAQALAGIDNLIDEEAKDKTALALYKHTVEEDKLAMLIEKPQLMKTPIVRNGAKATKGYEAEVWKKWE